MSPRGTVTSDEGRSQTQMWNVIRGPMGRSGFSAAELVVFGSTDDVKIRGASAGAYVKHLARAGYLLCLQKADRSSQAKWRLKPAMNTGPRPPTILRIDLVFDQNRAAVMGRTDVREDWP